MNNKVLKRKVNLALRREIEAVVGIKRVLNNNFYKAVELLYQTKDKIIVSGIGKSGHIGEKIASTFTSLGTPAIFLHSAEAFHGDLGLIGKNDTLLIFSKSGETKEIVKLVNHVRRHNIPVIAVTTNTRSILAKQSTVSLTFVIKNEGSPFNTAPMASATASLVIGDLLATALSIKKGLTKEVFADFHPGGTLGLQLTKVEELMSKATYLPLIDATVSFIEALKEITRKKFGITGIINKNKRLIGVITDGDIRRFLLSRKFQENAYAKDAMTRNPKTISKDDSLLKAISKMERHKITSLFVVDNFQKPIGIIHIHDIVEKKVT